jgi:hypothetical protein
MELDWEGRFFILACTSLIQKFVPRLLAVTQVQKQAKGRRG